MPAKDRPRRDINPDAEWPALKDSPEARLVSIPIGSDPDVDDDEEDDVISGEDRVVERWLNGGAVRDRH